MKPYVLVSDRKPCIACESQSLLLCLVWFKVSVHSVTFLLENVTMLTGSSCINLMFTECLCCLGFSGCWGPGATFVLRHSGRCRGAQAAVPSPSAPCLLPAQEEEGVCPLIQIYAPLWGQETREIAGSRSLRAILLRTGPFSSLPWVLCNCS